MYIEENGQVTLPIELRQELGLRKGDLLRASVKDGKISLERAEPLGEAPVAVPAWQLDRLAGIASLGGDAVKDAVRYDE